MGLNSIRRFWLKEYSDYIAGLNSMDEIIDDQREYSPNKNGPIFRIGWFVYGFVALVGVLFKILHWPYGYEGICIGFGGLSSHFLVYGLYKTKSKNTKIIFCSLPLMIFVLVLYLFKFYFDFLPLYVMVLAITFLGSYLIRK